MSVKKNTMKNFVSEETSDGKLEIHLKEHKDYYLPFNKVELDFRDVKLYERFIKNIESMIRKSKLYKAYIAYLKGTLKLTRCMVFGNIEEDEEHKKVEIEMHHGPIFTLYDYVEIVLRKNLIEGEFSKINTFDISAEVLALHHKNYVQTVMLSKSAHNSISKGKDTEIFLDIEQSFGNLNQFIIEYNKYMSFTHINKLKRYFERYEKEVREPSKVFIETLTKYDIILQDNLLE